MTQSLSTLTGNINIQEWRGQKEADVTGLCYDSRAVQKGFLFCALKGEHTDGHLHIADAIKRGAAAVLHQSELTGYETNIAFVQVSNVRRVMSELSARFYDNPSFDLDIIGVTGTNGKSTTAYAICQLLSKAGHPAGLLSTVYHDSGQGYKKNPFRQSTTESPEVHRLLHTMRSNGLRTVVLEATSHGLSEKTHRLSDVNFSGAVLTNVSHEHLEFHGSMESYINDKTNLFRFLNSSRSKTAFGIVNLDDANSAAFTAVCSPPIYTYALTKKADLNAEIKDISIDGSRFILRWGGVKREITTHLPGAMNVMNVMAALLTTAIHTGQNLMELAEYVPYLEAPTGRMQKLDKNQPFHVIVDFAHSPDAFKKLFPMVRSFTKGKVLAVFGSAGERDTLKRPIQGKIASRYCDIVILADEDPRGEESMSILEDIAAGCSNLQRNSNLFLIPDRKAAIEKAISMARKDDTVLLLGKGHESSIAYANEALAWDEVKIALEILTNFGY